MTVSFFNHTAATQKGIRRPGLVFRTEEVAQSWATTVSRALWFPGGCGSDTGILECFSIKTLFHGWHFVLFIALEYIRRFSSGHSSLHPFLLTGAGLDLSSS